ncbi:hypothetical protein B0H17DRAFT_1130051 [Mycena rosella]|uniref:Uncharacterized protein n=1 Tax=Mycena rosella TaxID=1033263 RepID=A0AAD7DUK0_MYCRO|nr:hypothetical protein B0H17DRAFT_1130051 [Mycena rosella]
MELGATVRLNASVPREDPDHCVPLLCDPQYFPDPRHEDQKQHDLAEDCAYYGIARNPALGAVSSRAFLMIETSKTLEAILLQHPDAVYFKASTWLRFTQLWSLECTEFHDHAVYPPLTHGIAQITIDTAKEEGAKLAADMCMVLAELQGLAIEQVAADGGEEQALRRHENTSHATQRSQLTRLLNVLLASEPALHFPRYEDTLLYEDDGDDTIADSDCDSPQALPNIDRRPLHTDIDRFMRNWNRANHPRTSIATLDSAPPLNDEPRPAAVVATELGIKISNSDDEEYTEFAMHMSDLGMEDDAKDAMLSPLADVSDSSDSCHRGLAAIPVADPRLNLLLPCEVSMFCRPALMYAVSGQSRVFYALDRALEAWKKNSMAELFFTRDDAELAKFIEGEGRRL